MAIRSALAGAVVLVASAGCAAEEPAPDPAATRAPSSSTSTAVTRTGAGETGTVAMFDNARGRGYITPDDGGPDVFVHFSQIKMDGFKKLAEGQRVTYVVMTGPRGPEATDVQVIDD